MIMESTQPPIKPNMKLPVLKEKVPISLEVSSLGSANCVEMPVHGRPFPEGGGKLQERVHLHRQGLHSPSKLAVTLRTRHPE